MKNTCNPTVHTKVQGICLYAKIHTNTHTRLRAHTHKKEKCGEISWLSAGVLPPVSTWWLGLAFQPWGIRRQRTQDCMFVCVYVCVCVGLRWGGGWGGAAWGQKHYCIRAGCVVSTLKCFGTRRSADPCANAPKIVFTAEALTHFPVITQRKCISLRAISPTETIKDILLLHFYFSSAPFVVVINFRRR